MKNETIYQIEKKRKKEDVDDVNNLWCKKINSNIAYQFYRL